ncbi:unnamed protein product [Triticum turgidum subsp. durum]|uniref:Gamma carbonic anhydrase-like 2, mitochondrial n=1 Tax=Triticum turgidum subsp. durum TaxID=4567 RepID=A0A9R1AZB8_TRITD|nr:unnamed protein product [Triticum turgidum subsp. durum]
MARGGKNLLASESGWQWSAQGFVARGSRGERQESEGVVGWAICPAGEGPPAEAVAITPTGKGDTRGAVDEGKHQGRVVVRGLPAETLVDRYVTVGAYCLLRSCTIEPECIIGQHSILMEGSLVETNSVLEAGSVLAPGRRIPTGELWAGNPARFVRKLTNEEIMEIPKLAVAINDLMQSHFSEFLPYSNAYLEVEKLKKSFSIPL